MKILMLSYLPDGEDVGEALFGYKWIREISKHAELTVLCLESPHSTPLKEQLPDVEWVTWPEPRYHPAMERFKAMLKPAYPMLYRKALRWIRDQQAQGRQFNLAHHFLPLPPRYPSPLAQVGIPYVIGPVGGGLATPPGFKTEMGSAKWYTRLRDLDGFRLRRDPWLRRSYRNAAAVIGVAPYMEELLRPAGVQRFEVMLELGIDDLPLVTPRANGGGLRLLHVGRGVRTKGLRDVVRAMAQLKDLPDLSLTSAGSGEEIEICRQEAETLGVSDRITFLGQVPKAKVESLYQQSDIFTFPSFREPAGSVFYESMRWGLPTITVDYGGPASIHTEETAIKLPISTPEMLARDVAGAIRTLHGDPERRRRMATAARARVSDEGLWDQKMRRLLALYDEVASLPPAGRRYG